MKRYLLILLLISPPLLPAQQPTPPGQQQPPLYFCMAADKQYYPFLLNLIGSIHHYNFDDVGEIAVFDIGFTPEQRAHLTHIAKVQVYDVERTHPDLLKQFTARQGKRNVPGWYAWKPVVLKQALDTFDEVLYLDSGIELQRDVRPCFEVLHRDKHVLVASIRNIGWMITDTAIKLLNLRTLHNSWLLEKKTTGITAYLMGVTHARYHEFVYPVYELTRDLRYFAEDGSNPTARHDQTLFSIYARRLNLRLTAQDESYFYDHSARKKLTLDDMFRFNMHVCHKELTMTQHIRFLA